MRRLCAFWVEVSSLRGLVTGIERLFASVNRDAAIGSGVAELKTLRYPLRHHLSPYASMSSAERRSQGDFRAMLSAFAFFAWIRGGKVLLLVLILSWRPGAGSQKLVLTIRSGTKKHSATNAGTTCPLILNKMRG